MKSARGLLVILATMVLALSLVVEPARTATTSYSFAGHWTGTAIVAGAQGATAMLTADFMDTGAKTFDGTIAVQANPTISCMAHGHRGGKRVSAKLTTCSDGSRAKVSGKLDTIAQTITGTFRSRSGKHHSRGTFALTKVPPTSAS